MKQYEVGSILYLIPESNFMSIPVQVVEEVIRKSINGETIDHYVQIPNKEEQVLLRDIKADIFQKGIKTNCPMLKYVLYYTDFESNVRLA